MGIQVTWRGDGRMERDMWRREMGAMVDMDVKGSATGMGLGVMSDREQVRVQNVPCHSRGRCENVLRGADQL